MDAPRATFVAVSLAAIRHNVRRLREITGVPVMAVVKANAYGHGAVEAARAAVEAGAEWLGVAFTEEGVALRRAGLAANILVLGYTPPHLAVEAFEYDLSLTVYDLDLAKVYRDAARALNVRARLHIKVDTGMGRLGMTPEEALMLTRIIQRMSGADAEGLFTHFAAADEADAAFTHEQLRRFQSVLNELGSDGPRWVHAANSAAALRIAEARFNLVRCGIAMYGLHPSPFVLVPQDFLPALEWKSVVSQVKTLPPRSPVSYGGEYVTKGEERIAVVPVGYADGFRRFPKNVARVLIGGARAPVVGRVCMDQIMVNVDAVPEVKIGDEVVLIGRQGGGQITADDAAAWWGTINYDVVSGIMARVPRVYED
jgi:alanine racemase